MILTEKDQERFWSKVAPADANGCMLWLASLHPSGYAKFSHGGGWRRAHRVSYTLTYGQIPDGLVIDHVKANGCRHRHCVAPLHLEAVTPQENTRRGMRGDVRSGTHCPQGHEYTGENLYVAPKGDRRCRTCAEAHRVRNRARQASSGGEAA